ncbi:M56 family metallopeptidase [Massilia sp. NR 4-1]|uniref:M56 family metallopeptidase n=1 Tax=Massilia sp. NR 4-1 TaxID=1678028 RepID=UPI00067BBB10|nr:M56 family metallopeptidase [Massilia sp. NR 4-1]
MAAALQILYVLTLALSAALLLVFALRPLLLYRGGAPLAYVCWGLVPLLLLACLLPHPASDAATGQARALAIDADSAAAHAVQLIRHAASAAPDAGGAPVWLFGLWLGGALAMAAALGWQQARFTRSLGSLRPTAQPGVYLACSSTAGPALIGLLRPRIVLPADFAERYTAQEQQLILLHEDMHRQRGDLYANVLCSVLQTIFWFHPLMHVAAGRFRFDQELACDHAVLHRQPQARRSYAQAILKTQLAASGLPLGCSWQSQHPLKGRLMSMTKNAPHRFSRIGARCLLVALALPACYSAWAGAAAIAPQPAANAAGAAAAPKAQEAVPSPTSSSAAAPAAKRTAAKAAPAALPAGAAAANTPGGTPSSAPSTAAMPVAAAAPAPAASAAPAAKTEGKDEKTYQLAATYSFGSGAERSFRIAGLGIGAQDSSFRIASDTDTEPCGSEWSVSFVNADTARLSGIVRCRGAVVAQPAITVKVGQPGAIKYQGEDADANFRLSVLVTPMLAVQ